MTPVAPRAAPSFDGQRICRQLNGLVSTEESGQADAPLTKATAKLCERTLEQESLRIALVSFTPASRDIVLRHFLGNEFSLPLDALFTGWKADGIELDPGQTGYALSCGPETQIFSSREDFLRAAAEPGPESKPGSLRVLRVSFPMQAPVPPVRLLLGPEAAVLCQRPKLISYLADEVHCLFLAGSAEDRAGPSEGRILSDLVADVSALQPVIVGEEAKILPAWAQLRASFVFPPIFLLPETNGGGAVNLLPEERRPSRELILQHRLARRAEMLVTLARHKTQDEIELCQRKKQVRESGLPGMISDDGQIKKSIERATARLSEDFKALAVSVDDTARNSLLKSGTVYEFIHRNDGACSVYDIDLIDKESVTVLQLKEKVAARLQAENRAFLDHFLQNENSLISDGVATATEETSQTLASILGAPLHLENPLRDESRFNAYRDMLLQSTTTYRNEIPRHKKSEIALQVIQAPVMIYMGITMPITMLSGLDIMSTLRTWRGEVAAFLIVPLYAYCTHLTLKKFKAQREAALEKELKRVQDLIESDREKLCRQILEERKKHWGDYFARCLESLRKQIDGVLGEFARKKDLQRLNDRQDNTVQLQALDRRLRDYTSRLQQYDGLARELEQGKRTLETAFQASLSAARTAALAGAPR
jgi:hypothetical protein